METRLGEASGVVPPVGLKLLVPGYAQWSWGQRERAAVLFGSCVVAGAVGVFAWGTVTGLVVLAFAFGTHTASAIDAVRQNAFPGPGRWPTFLGVSLGLAVAGYAPGLGLASMLAWPGMRTGPTPAGGKVYLVNRWAYRRAEPRQADLVWYHPDPRSEPRLGRVVAAGGQEVDWSEDRLQIDGRVQPNPVPIRSGRIPRRVVYRVPERHVLIEPGWGRPGARCTEGLRIVACNQVIGRAWAQMYPVHERRWIQ